MNILFIWVTPDYSFPMSLSSLSSYMKKARNCRTKMTTVIARTNILHAKDFAHVRQDIESFKPDICAFTVFEPCWHATKSICDDIKAHYPHIKNVLGGYFPMLKPEIVIAHPSVDALCIGEGENGFPEYVDWLNGDIFPHEIPNFWIKDSFYRSVETHDGSIRNNRVALITALDELPFPDRECVDFQWYLDLGKPDRSCKILASRGCPLACTYCSVEKFRSMYPNLPKEYMRFRSVDNVISEIQLLANKYDFETIGFHDDNPLSMRKWLLEFCDKYIAIGKPFPFYMAGRPETAHEGVARRLKEAGCYLILMGLENGDEEMRTKVMNRPMSNKKIFDSFKVIHDAGIGTWSFNMAGTPGETFKTMWETFKLNWKIKPDFAMCSVYYPLQGTTLGDKCFNEGLVDMELYKVINSYAMKSVLKLPTVSMYWVTFFKWAIVFTAIRKPFFWKCLRERIFGRFKKITREASNMIPNKLRKEVA